MEAEGVEKVNLSPLHIALIIADWGIAACRVTDPFIDDPGLVGSIPRC